LVLPLPLPAPSRSSFAFADESLFMPDLSRRKILIWGLVLVTGSAPCLLLASAVSL
jgi:hypothetical protein